MINKRENVVSNEARFVVVVVVKPTSGGICIINYPVNTTTMSTL